MQPLNVHFLPAMMNTANLAGGTVVIIDILRASSTIITALHNGAKRVIPCGTPEEARQIREQSHADDVLLGGERGGVLIEGFDCGNSPAEYAPGRVAGKTIAFTTTNGTQALLKSAAAETILIGAFVNRRAVAERLHDDQRPVHLSVPEPTVSSPAKTYCLPGLSWRLFCKWSPRIIRPCSAGC